MPLQKVHFGAGLLGTYSPPSFQPSQVSFTFNFLHLPFLFLSLSTGSVCLYGVLLVDSVASQQPVQG